MDVAQMIFAIPIVAIVGGLATGMVKMLIDASERRMEMKIRLKEAGMVRANDPSVAPLREEFERFKETSTQYDLSLDHTLREIEARLASLERRSAVARPAADEARSQQIAGRSE